jgi:hypothetical protein
MPVPKKPLVQMVQDFMAGKAPLLRMKAAGTAEKAREKALRTVLEMPQGKNTAAEPNGAYFALHGDDLIDLIDPGATASMHYQQPFKENVNAAAIRYHRRNRTEPRNDWDRPINKLIKATPNPEDPPRVGMFDDSKWRRELAEFTDAYPEHQKIVESSLNAGVHGAPGFREAASRDLTKWLGQEHDVVVFPDIVAGQPDVYQAVALKTGKLIGKLGKVKKVLGGIGTAGEFETSETDARSDFNKGLKGLESLR